MRSHGGGAEQRVAEVLGDQLDSAARRALLQRAGGDAENAYNSLERASLLRFLASPEAEEAGLLPLLPAAHAQLSLATQCTDRGALLPIQLRRGLPQGDPWSTDLFCLGVHAAFRQLDEELRGTRQLPAGAPPMPPVDPTAPPPVFVGVRAFADDNHIYCAPERSQWALDRLGELLRPLGLSEVVSKRQCFAPPAIRPRLPPTLVQTAVCELGAGGPVVKCGVDSSGRVVAGTEAAIARGVLVARGIEVAGVPEGEPGYVQARMAARLDEAESNAKLLREILCTVGHRHQALCLLRYCVAPLLDHFAACCYPEDSQRVLIRFDRVVFVLHGLITGVPLAPPTPASTATEKRRVMRLRLPARYGGLGLRARSSWLKCAAFLGAVDQALPSFVDRVAANGAIERGIFPSLTAVLGVGSFNTGGSKYATILASNTRMGRQLSTAWQQLQAVAGVGQAGSQASLLLAGPDVAGLKDDGSSRKQLQRLLTAEVEAYVHHQVDAAIRALPGDANCTPAEEWERRSWRNVQGSEGAKTAQKWVTAWPKPHTTYDAPTLALRVCTYLGMELTVLSAVVGAVIRRDEPGRPARAAGECDAYGSRLACCNLDDAFRRAHDEVQHAIADIVSDVRGLSVDETPYGVFFNQLTGAQHQQVVTAVGYRDRQAMVPDLRIHGLEGRGPSYFELKLLRASRNTYPSGVRGGATGVEKLALAVNREHIGRLTDLDEQLYGVAAGPRQHGHSTRPPNPGPLVRAYDSLGAVQPIVFGYLAEASAGACDLIKSVADELAPRYADLYLLESVEAAVGIATDRLREEIGAAVFKAQARVILDRIRYCYRGNRAADARRHLQQARWRSRAEHARSHGRPRGRYSLLHRRP